VGVLKHPVASYWLLVLPKKKPATSNQQQFKISRNLLNNVISVYSKINSIKVLPKLGVLEALSAINCKQIPFNLRSSSPIFIHILTR